MGYTREGAELRTLMSSSQLMRSLSFFLSERQLRQYLVELDRPEMIDKLVQVSGGLNILTSAELSPLHHHLISKLSTNPYRGTLEKLYLESVAGELLIALLESLGEEHKTANINLTERDRDQLLIARRLLLKDLRNPPTISQLAKAVGMNEDKLKKGYKVVFNNTIFKTVMEQRMQFAPNQLRSNDMSIAEIAYAAGYENVSKFIATFRKTYGVTPGMMRKDMKYSLPMSHS
ncbi:MAG: AraC family transcriptional regulator [Candidatus Thiodiazotropha sp. (ex Lucina aurantia)]|nr:AraC family transcriptional regulator [Candidatus Thiodiazotropha sp. (ex Codakia orbicularis)]MBV2104068.1 AraC family transcriptional regulator [Candidatus Thiodiazotropha sp. (ex Lucina aurantia)]